MVTQNFKNHAQYVKGFHFTLIPILFICFILSVVNIFWHTNDGLLMICLFIPLMFLFMIWLALLARTFALKAQNRAIRAEENLRYFVLNGKLYPPALTLGQVIALRFAPDDELLALTDRAIVENLSPKEIKMAVLNWKGDYHRV